MAEKNILCAYGIDVDAVAGWLWVIRWRGLA